MNENLPRAYKLGYQDFYGFRFKVTKDVLIPRPETEFIVDAVLNLAGISYLSGVKASPRKLPSKPKILDVGTGSGCIAIAIKKKFPEAEVSAVDSSEKALQIAKENASALSADITFLKSDLLSNINFSPNIIVANLPYVDIEWDWLDKKALSYEPAEALFAKNHGLELIFRLIDQAHIAKATYLILEADPCEHQSILSYAASKYQLLETRGFILNMRLIQH